MTIRVEVNKIEVSKVKKKNNQMVSFLMLLGAQLMLMPIGFSAEGKIELTYDLEHSDNVFLSTTDEQSDTSNTLGANLMLVGNSGRFEYNVDSRISYKDFQTTGIDNEWALDGGVSSTLHILPKKLIWELSDFAAQRRVNPAGPRSAENSELVNTFATGPTWTIGITDQDDISFSADYRRTDYPDSEVNVDSSSVTYGMSWSHLFSRLTSMGLSVSHTDLSEDNQEDRERESANLSLSRQFKTSSLSLSAGRSWLVLDDNREAFSVYSAQFRKQLSGALSLFLLASQDVSSQGESLAQRIERFNPAFEDDLSGLNDEEIVVLGDIVEAVSGIDLLQGVGFEIRESASVGFDWTRAGKNWHVDVYQSRLENPETKVIEEDNVGVNLSTKISPGARTSVTLGINAEDRESFGFEGREDRAYISSRYYLYKNLSLTGEVSHERRNFDVDSTGIDTTAQENTIMLGVIYEL